MSIFIKNSMSKPRPFFFIIFFTFYLCSCSNEDACIEIESGTSFEFEETDRFCVDRNLEFSIDQIIDQRCPCDVACIWEGEFVFYLRIIQSGNDYLYQWHEKLENLAHPVTGLKLIEIERIFDDSCDAMTPISEMRFSAIVSFE